MPRNRKKLIETILFLTMRKNWSPIIVGELMGKIEFGNYQILPDKQGKSFRIIVE